MTAIIALTPAGRALAERLQVLSPTPMALHYKPTPFQETAQSLFQQGEPLIFICAAGIVVRTLAPVLQDKYRDPPVLVLDEGGRFVIPLLSGHEGGANEWGRQIAERLNAQLVLTTAQPYLEPVYTLGMGCERHCPLEALEELADQCLAQVGLISSQIQTLASIDIKADEVGLIELARRRNWTYQTWSPAHLSAFEGQLTQKSDIVFRETGVYGVAEAAALASAAQLSGAPAELALPKHKNRRATCAVARSYLPRKTET
ncbi:cobalamin biosynthesis protein CbiG [Hahella sp. KA22]|uniref:cobalamin biosynthesis protein n=1 Tax=Hahella sp. KA22 TaxID=1628392 RepID=UPI000FDE8A82|nr:cobalamin biosynthesis protein [Hahella sp. KA22]AZZ94907.1 cobalamin biosynthesis protein CbiG [Hahella sp. KA22]QAY52551.1 cobalamin biosynthesis protein CbiG [Hahella sp. KA22]